MRLFTPLAVLLCAVVVLGAGAAGIALAGAASVPTGTLAGLGDSASRPAEYLTTDPTAGSGARTEPGGYASGSPAAPTVTVAPLVTVPALTSAEVPPPPAAVETPAVQTPAPPPVAAAEPADPIPPATAVDPPPAPADVPVVAPYATVIGWHGEDKTAYLTFDDGPGPATGRVLDILAANGVSATFCQLGLRVAQAPELTQRVVAEGHTLCNHSWDHYSPFDTLAPADLDSEIGRTQDAFTQAVDTSARYFRAPEGAFGATGGTVLQAAQRARTIPLGWGVDSLDWRKPGVDSIIANVLTAVTPGAVILLHDGGGQDREQTLAALPGIITGLRAAGYTLAAMPPNPAG